ncbi:YoaK family protein [Rhodanobacter sp. BL-MT-08]
MLLSSAGGFLDAFTWLGHGGVFANAQTGNVVLLGIYAASGQWGKSLRHVPPILAFFIGVFVAFRLRLNESRQSRQRTALISLAIEIAFLVVVAVLPRGFPDLPIVLGVAFLAALQSTSFARVEGSPYSSVMTTGNLRRTAELLFTGLFPPGDATARHQARIFAMVCCSFAIGACAGGFATAKVGNPGVLVPALALSLALVRCRRVRPPSATTSQPTGESFND